MSVVSKSENRILLESPTHKSGIRLDWEGDKKVWLLTAYEKTSSPTNRTTDIDSSKLKNDTAPLQGNDVSYGKDKKIKTKRGVSIGFPKKLAEVLNHEERTPEEYILQFIAGGGLMMVI